MIGGFVKTSTRFIASSSCAFLATCYHPPHPRTADWDLSGGEKRPDRLTAQQQLAETTPTAPASFSPDPSLNPPLVPLLPEAEWSVETLLTEDPLLPPSQFNPDPGAVEIPAPVATANREIGRFFKDDLGANDTRFFSQDAGVSKDFPKFKPSIPGELLLPRQPIEQRHILARLAADSAPITRYQPEIAPSMVLPRSGVRYEKHIVENWHAGTHEDAESPPNTTAIENRYHIPTGQWQRYLDDRIAETPYAQKTPYRWHPYYQSLLKGDIPIKGQDLFTSLTLQNSTDIEIHDLPIPSGVSTTRPDRSEFFGRGDQMIINTNTSLTFDLFKGETSFKPVEWLFRIQPVFNTNFISGYEANVVSPDPRGLNQTTGNALNNSGITNPGDVNGLLDPQLDLAPGDLSGGNGTDRFENRVGLQQFFFETHLLDLSENYDFAALRVGTQSFNADFRGHVFTDSNWGYRLLGNLQKNRIQYNLALFDLFEKESFSDLNTFQDRNQNVFVANVFYQDFLTEGYTAQFSFLGNWDNGTDSGLVYDSAGSIVRPSPIGTVAPHDLQTYYLGWSGEGHIGPANLSHSLYHVFGTDDLNGLSGQAVDISAWMAAMELSVDTDWMRHKLVLFFGSGDDDATDTKATGWDAIVDNPNFIGPFSYWQRQGMNLAGTAVSLKQRLSLIPELGSNKFLGQSNFVNPGIFIAGLGEEWELTPRLRAFANANYLYFVSTNPIETALLTGEINREIGWDLSIGIEYRPLLTENLKLNFGIGMLLPGQGFQEIYSNAITSVPGYTDSSSQDLSDVFYSCFLTATMTF